MPDGVAVSVTSVFGGKVLLHVPLTMPIVIAQLMPVGELVTVPVPEPPPLIVSPWILKITSAMCASDIASWQGSVVQAPAQASNTASPVLDCCSVTTVLSGKSALHVPLEADPEITQLMPAGTLVITPDPVAPAPRATVSRWGAAVKPTLTALVMPLVTGITHVPPVHEPAKPSKVPPLLAPPINVTGVLAAKLAVQIPVVIPAVIVHEMPDGELLTAPLPVPLPATVTIPGAGSRKVTAPVRGCVIVI